MIAIVECDINLRLTQQRHPFVNWGNTFIYYCIRCILTAQNETVVANLRSFPEERDFEVGLNTERLASLN